MKKFNLIFALGVILAAASCAKVEFKQPETAFGSLEMSMSIDEMTKAMTEDELRSSAIVNIYYKDYSGRVRTYAYNEIPSPFYLTVGEYRADVIAGECVAETPAPASWDSKSYKGSADFTIEENKSASVEVVASVNNAVTNISFDQTVADNFNPGYEFSICLDSEDPSTKLVYTADNSGADGYFIVSDLVLPSFKWTFTGVQTKDGSTLTKSGEIADIEGGKLYKMTLRYTVKDGELEFSLWVDTMTDNITDEIIFEPVSTGLSATPSYEIWAARATLYADVDAEESAGKTVQFSYSSDGTSWTDVDGVNYSEGAWKADIKGLTPDTEYTYKLLIDGTPIGDPMTLITEKAPNLPNASFEYVSKVSNGNYYKFYNPSCGVEEGSYMFWGSGNGEGADGIDGSASMNIVITDIDESDKKHGNQSVLCKNNSIVGMLTAGNLFTGQFSGLVGTSGGIVNFGRPWESRPSAMKIWCKYTTDKINILKNNNLGVTKNDYDRAQIKVAIGTWTYKQYGGTKDSPVQVNTTDESTFVDFYTDPATIANGDLIIYHDGYSINKGAKVSANTSGWIEYTIPLDYRQLTTYPTHIVVSCATSQFGDYFSGYDGGKLWIDAIELIYE